ncbi:PREDICTED: uncharacterized protein LOC109128693 [Camelina sativa]|uniref:Uncharacterized protein LOC109128693 n=1 Tax=Camelina sativa TaxID=90675 RepID=A0ABM1QWE0_CAMSA|nr:PREDICTED: uncharacterized protein LOC109128693 [Camelina sativa]
MRKLTTELIWLKALLKDLGIETPKPITMHCDNEAAIHIASNSVFHERTKHIEVDCHKVREQVQLGVILPCHTKSSEQLADIFTKAASPKKYKRDGKLECLPWNKYNHTLALFPTQTPFTCSVCALIHLKGPLYIYPPCDFAVHQKCFNLPQVIRISRHPHRISFTTSFGQGDWYCGVCRRRIDNDYGGYSCIKDGCLYATHSKCGTQRNVWDGKELEGEPEEVEEEVEPFVRISDGVIQHFSHEHHHLRLDENTDRDYDENKLCQACITPIYFGNFYSCMQCDYILHQTCANFSCKMHHPIHPHLLTLVNYDGVVKDTERAYSACPWFCTAGFVYECSEEGCYFQLHVQCTAITEPLVRENHMHPLFLTSKPGEDRGCYVCRGSKDSITRETFNCIEECHFSLCFGSATLPQTVRYKHDKHMLTLSYGNETSILAYWCEACEGKINPKEGFYMCYENCCVTLHITCMLGKDLYLKPGSSMIYDCKEVHVLSNNHHMSRPICSRCRKRCPQKIVFKYSDLIACSISCIPCKIKNPQVPMPF